MTSSSPLSSQLQDQLGCFDVGLDDVNGLLDGEPNIRSALAGREDCSTITSQTHDLGTGTSWTATATSVNREHSFGTSM